VLLATDQGLRVFDRTAGTVTKADFPEPPQRPQVLARDALGRLWLGGKNGLWLVDTAAKTVESLEAVPSIGRNEVHSLAPVAHHEDGMIVALGPDGIVIVRAPRKP
jgi:ligand-binding sensor domain-containing protein